ncbi:type I restriction-modification system, M subunit [Burkholderia sp. YI23]|nr:type I restriction-modification system, M subunit [Burkholderia sp. YI23]
MQNLLVFAMRSLLPMFSPPLKHCAKKANSRAKMSMVEIEESGFNLNIARYVSTAAVQEKIDLHALSLELKGIAENSTKAAKTHNTFLKELGLPPI